MINWQPLEKDQLNTLIDSVASRGMPGLFSAGSSQGKRSALPFYNGFYIYDLKNFSTLPVFTMQYLGNDSEFFYLDGSPTPIYQVNENYNALKLDQTNIVDYVSFFFTYVSILEEEADMIRDPENLPYYEYLSDEQKQIIAREKQNVQIEFSHDSQLYSLHCPLYYGGSLVKAMIQVDMRGHVTVKDYKLLFGVDTGNQGAVI